MAFKASQTHNKEASYSDLHIPHKTNEKKITETIFCVKRITKTQIERDPDKKTRKQTIPK